MKITTKHYNELKDAIDIVLSNYNQDNALVIEYENGRFPRSKDTKDLQRRFCFDVLFGAGLSSWVSCTLYPYLNDDQVYTALKRICPKVTKQYEVTR